MTSELASKSAFEAYGAICGQGILPVCPLPIGSNPYLVRHCGTCNEMCNVPFNEDYNWYQALTPYNPLLDAALNEVGGLAFDIAGATTDATNLPSLVPLIWDCPGTIPPHEPLYAVSPETLLKVQRRGNHFRVYPVDNLRRSLGLRPDARLLLTGNGHDDLLLWMWQNKATATAAIEANLFDYVATPNYSAYGNKCPVEWVYNQKRSLVFLDHIRNATPNPVITVTIQNQRLLDHTAEWLQRNPQVGCVAANLQMMKNDHELEVAARNLRRLQQAVGRSLRVIVAGPNTEHRIGFVRDMLGSATIVSSFHYNGGRPSRQLLKGGEIRHGEECAFRRRTSSRSRKRSLAGL